LGGRGNIFLAAQHLIPTCEFHSRSVTETCKICCKVVILPPLRTFIMVGSKDSLGWRKWCESAEGVKKLSTYNIQINNRVTKGHLPIEGRHTYCLLACAVIQYFFFPYSMIARLMTLFRFLPSLAKHSTNTAAAFAYTHVHSSR
jgi:hypothetical protein